MISATQYKIDEDILNSVIRDKEREECIIITDTWGLRRIIQSTGEWWKENKHSDLEKNAFPRKLNQVIRNVLPNTSQKGRLRYRHLATSYFGEVRAKQQALEKDARKTEEARRQPSFNFG